MLCDAGRGHFDFSDRLVDYLAMFIRKSAAARLPKTDGPVDAPVELNGARSVAPRSLGSYICPDGHQQSRLSSWR
jgi:hypothetical protein